MALRNGQVQILVATDVAARGIDVPTITHVFNFGLPMKSEDYTHRIGRTGRAGRDGLAVTFAEFRDRRKIFDIEAYSQPAVQGRGDPRPGAAAAHAACAAAGLQCRPRRPPAAAPRGDRVPAPRAAAPAVASYGRKSQLRRFRRRRRVTAAVRRAAPWEKPAQGFARPARPGNGGKVFVPRDAKKRAYKPAR